MSKETERNPEPRPLFDLGQVVATHRAISLLEESGENHFQLLVRHITGDWGDLGEEDKQANNEAVHYSNRIISAYELLPGQKLWIITEWNRSVTTLLRPNEY